MRHGKGVSYGSATFGNSGSYYTVTFRNLVITGENINDDTRVTIVTSRSATGNEINTTITIGDLREN